MTFNTAVLQALWHWIGANAFAIFAGVYLVSALCVILLACQLASLSRKVAAVRRASEKQAALVGRLAKSLDQQTLAFEAIRTRAPAEAKGAEPDDAAADRSTTVKAVRDDIESLIAEMRAESSERGDPMP